MANNFKIRRTWNNRMLVLQLNGNFDGSSSMELIDALKACQDVTPHIIVDTCGLAAIHPFGVDVFHKSCSGINRVSTLNFIGPYASAMMSAQGMV